MKICENYWLLSGGWYILEIRNSMALEKFAESDTQKFDWM